MVEGSRPTLRGQMPKDGLTAVAEPTHLNDVEVMVDRRASRLKIMHVISGLTAGGAETVMFRLITEAKSIDHEVICLGPPEWYSRKLEEQGVTVHHVDFRSPAHVFTRTRHLYRLIKSSDASLVQGWMYRGNILGG